MQHDPHPRNVRQPGWASDSKPPLFSWSQASLTSSCSKKQFGSNWSWQESEHQMLRVLLVVAPIEAFGLVNIKHTLLRMSQPNWPHSFSQVRVWHWLNHINITHIPRLKAYCKPCFVLVISSHQLLSGVARTYMFQVFGPPGVGGGCVCSVFMVSHPCGVGWGGKGVAYAVWENYNSWCIQTSGT